MGSPQIVDAVDMIGMGMGVKHGIDMAQAFAQGLLAKIGGGVDDDLLIAMSNQHTAAGSPVTRIGGTADGTGTAEHRHAGTRSRTENGDLKPLCHDGRLSLPPFPGSTNFVLSPRTGKSPFIGILHPMASKVSFLQDI
jgi:hypothetical protein